MSKSIILPSVLVAFLVAVIIALILGYGGDKKQQEFLVGVIMPGSVSEIGWNGVHYKGISEAASELGVKTILVENVKEGSGLCTKAIDSLVHVGARMIILGSYNYGGEVEEIIRKYPEVKFFCCAAAISMKNYKVYFARIYQARYLSGLIAGTFSKSGKIGYVAAMNNYEVNRGINAFTLGVRKANPKAEVVVAWTGSWDDPEIERQNVEKLIERNQIDVVAYHQNQDAVLKAAEEYGIASVGYNLESTKYSPKVLTSVVTNWRVVYKEIIQDYVQNKKSISNYWVGIEKDAVGLSFYSSEVSDSSKMLVEDAIAQMKGGMDIFMGPLYDNMGQKRCNKDEILSDEILRENMDWFVDGVKIYEE